MNDCSQCSNNVAFSTVNSRLRTRHVACQQPRMLRRSLWLSSVALALTSLTSLSAAQAAPVILPSSSATPLEQRIAVAVSPSRTTVWTNLRLDSAANSVGLLVPVPSGAALDHSSDAWLEALDDATAPRLLPPTGAAYVCPGTSPDPMADPFHVTTFPSPLAGLAPTQSTILPDASAVSTWATANGLTIAPATLTALQNMSGMRFFVERFEPKTAPFFTSTLRVVLPSSTPTLPLALTRAGSSDLHITAWFVGAGRANLTGSSSVKLPVNDLQWIAKTQTSNYIELRDTALLTAGPSASVTEASSHDALVKNVAIAEGKGAITGVVTGYFQRAADYLDGNMDANPCIVGAAVVLDGSSRVALTCPRANLGVVDGGPACVESPAGSEVDPAKLRCGGRADDLAVALSDLQPSSAWLTRMTMIIPKDALGQTWPVTFTAVAPTLDPTETAAGISFTGCDGMSSSGSTSSSSSGNGASSGSGGPWTTSSGGTGAAPPVTPEPDYDSDMSCGCGPAAAPIITGYGGSAGYGGEGGFAGDGGAGGDVVYEDTSSDDCSGDTTESTDPYADTSSSDDCGGDTTESTDPYADSSSSDDCGGDTTESTDSSSDSSSSDDCGGDTTESTAPSTDPWSDTTSTTDTSSSSDSDSGCGSDTGSGGSAGSSLEPPPPDSAAQARVMTNPGDGTHCSFARPSRAKPSKRGPKASVLTLGLLAILAPLRRITRPRKRTRPQDKPTQNQA